MTTRGRRGKRKRTGSSGGFGSMVGDTAAIANKFGPVGVLVTGVGAFIFFYITVPWLLTRLAEHGKDGLSGSATGQAMRTVLDEVFLRRFIHPSEWAGIAALVICLLLAVWKMCLTTGPDSENRERLTWIGKLLARFLD